MNQSETLRNRVYLYYEKIIVANIERESLRRWLRKNTSSIEAQDYKIYACNHPIISI